VHFFFISLDHRKVSKLFVGGGWGGVKCQAAGS
jgi:hypothetical protein